SWLPAPARSAAPGGALAMVSRNAEHVDVFWSAQDGGVQARSWNGSGPIADSDPNRPHPPPVAHRDPTRGRQERAMVRALHHRQTRRLHQHSAWTPDTTRPTRIGPSTPSALHSCVSLVKALMALFSRPLP